MKTKIRKTLIFGIILFFMSVCIYFFFQPIHMPICLTSPYDITVQCGTATINTYVSEKKEIYIPDRILGIKIISIEENAFKRLGTHAVILNIPENIHYAYNLYDYESQCYYMIWNEHLYLEKYIGNQRKIEVPEKVWGRDVTVLSVRCFLGTGIEEISLPNTITYIGGGAFRECKNLKQITLPPSLDKIALYAFKNSGIESIELPKTVKEIGEGAFECSALKEITGLENVVHIGNRAFRGTPWEENTEGDFVCIDDALYLYRGMETEVVIPSSITEIRGAFYKDDEYDYPINVTKVFIPQSVTAISPESFAGQKDIEVYIPESVISLGDDYENPLDQSKECIFENRLDGIIVTTGGSPAEAYAIEQRIPYRIITKEEMLQEMNAAKHILSSNS